LLARQLVQVLEHVADVEESLAALGARRPQVHHPRLFAHHPASRKQVIQLGVFQSGELTAFPVGRNFVMLLGLPLNARAVARGLTRVVKVE
jgi:hypothetical protein